MSTGFAPAQPSSQSSPDAKLAFHLHSDYTHVMNGRRSEQLQSGLSLPYHAKTDHQSYGSSSDEASAAQYLQGQDPRRANFSSSATPTSEYGLPSSSAHSGSFLEYINFQHHPPAGQGQSSGGMAQATSPSQPGQDGHAINNSAASHTHPLPHQQQYPPFVSQREMPHDPSNPSVYGQPHWPASFVGSANAGNGLASPASTRNRRTF